MPMIDHSYGRIPVAFPDKPFETKGMFAAYIVSFLPDDPEHRRKRKFKLLRQLRWWRLMTDMPVHLFASNWANDELDSEQELQLLTGHGGSFVRVAAQPLISNRIACLTAFYASTFPWGVMMDDDAILYHSPDHNSGAALFNEMTRNGLAAYHDVDVFFPINPGKLPGQNQIWSEAPDFYKTRHVFHANYDLKGSMFVVRNFRLDGRAEVFPPSNHLLHGEDTLFAVEAIANGCSVHRCENIVLKELSGSSHFTHTKAQMQIGNEAIAARYAGQGLRMSQSARSTHLLDRTEFVAAHLSGRRLRVVVRKPD